MKKRPFTEDIFRFAQQEFERSLTELRAYGLTVNPALELRRGKGLLCHYSLNDGQIYFSPPDFSEVTGKLHLLFLRSLLACENDEEVFEMFYLLLPYVINHELGHHLRHHSGLFGEDLWLEEQIADQFASAMTKRRLPPGQKKQAQEYLARAVKGLSSHVGDQNRGTETYYDMWQALKMGGHFEAASQQQMKLAQKLFAIDPLQVLAAYHDRDLSQWLEKRTQGIAEINEHYASDAVQYLYYQLQWMLMSLMSSEYSYIDAFACEYLDRRPLLLSDISIQGPSDGRAILACFRAYQDVLEASPTGSRYFYKRYRSLLLAQLYEFIQQANNPRLSAGYRFLLQHWRGDAQHSDLLNYVSPLVPQELQRLFPHYIANHPLLANASEDDFPTETDRRVWQHLALDAADEAAANTLARLAVLEKMEMYRSLPAEVSLKMSRDICRVLVSEGETIIWQGDENRDVYILITGELHVFMSQNGHERLVQVINEGEAFGEMAILTNAPRSATVKAAKASECFVLKENDFYLLAFKYPSVLMEIAKTLAQRIVKGSKGVAQTN